MARKKVKYIFYEDPGHAWLKVSIAELIRLDIVNKISAFSYIRGGYAYLEEDCDFSIFFNAKKDIDGIAIQWKTLFSNKSSKIRNYAGFNFHHIHIPRIGLNL